MIRTFIAIDVPDEVKNIISRAQENLRRIGSDRISWTRSQSIHLTLKFLGDVNEEEISDIANRIETAVLDFSYFDIQTTSPGGFPRIQKPRVLWLGIDGGDALINIADAADKGLSKLGFDREKKIFNPHLTVGRVKSLSPNSELPFRFSSMDFGSVRWTAEEVNVMASELKPTGAVYTVLDTIPLKFTK